MSDKEQQLKDLAKDMMSAVRAGNEQFLSSLGNILRRLNEFRYANPYDGVDGVVSDTFKQAWPQFYRMFLNALGDKDAKFSNKRTHHTPANIGFNNQQENFVDLSGPNPRHYQNLLMNADPFTFNNLNERGSGVQYDFLGAKPNFFDQFNQEYWAREALKRRDIYYGIRVKPTTQTDGAGTTPLNASETNLTDQTGGAGTTPLNASGTNLGAQTEGVSHVFDPAQQGSSQSVYDGILSQLADRQVGEKHKGAPSEGEGGSSSKRPRQSVPTTHVTFTTEDFDASYKTTHAQINKELLKHKEIVTENATKAALQQATLPAPLLSYHQEFYRNLTELQNAANAARYTRDPHALKAVFERFKALYTAGETEE
ncbi:hypothetical protein HK097_005747 [Rhizophlyctis rosea]|uniref:Uncharacterized protein n=1 Tax=Rhizophlyctis rosea TaxID=64517 RepID=A0AAD5S1E4_9FUNG|nr:hypothetical protein HK097_005747 [Rhizophlyctis rosea]